MPTFRKSVLILAIVIICGSVFLILNGIWPLDKVGDTYTGINIPNDQSERVQRRDTENVSDDIVRFNVYDTPLARPSFTFMAGPDQTVDLSEFTGKKLIVNLWATWCAPCVEELPSLARLKQRLLDEGAGFDVITISIDAQKDFSDIRKFLDKHDADILPPYMDAGGQVLDHYNLSSFPATIIFNEQGQQIAEYLKPLEWDSDNVIEALNRL